MSKKTKNVIYSLKFPGGLRPPGPPGRQYEQCHLPMIGVLGPGFLASSAELRPSSGRAAIHGFASKILEKSLAPHEKSIKSIDFIDFS